MLESLKQTSRNIGQEINRGWGNLAEGWRELFSRSSNALTHFTVEKFKDIGRESLENLPRWSLLAGEVEETDTDIVVRLELPGMEKEDFHISITGNTLYLNGEKHFRRESHDSTYHVMERAYGSFHRAIQLPRNIHDDKAKASYRNGVLSVHIPISKSENGSGKVIRVD